MWDRFCWPGGHQGKECEVSWEKMDIECSFGLVRMSEVV